MPGTNNSPSFEFSRRSLLITGGAGFIGANFVRYWQDNYPEDTLTVLDLLTYAGNLENLKGLKENNYSFVQGDIADGQLIGKLLEEKKIDTIVNFAAESHVDRSIHGPDQFVDTNIVGTHVLLKAAREVWLNGDQKITHRFHHVSTDEVYGSLEPEERPFTEETPYTPNSPYSASKASADHLVRAYHHTYGLDVTTSNCSNNYGAYQFPEKLIPLIIINALHGKKLPIYGDGLNIRDWLYVEDHCRAIDLVLKKGTPGEVYNVGGLNEWTNIDIVRLICSLMDDSFKDDPDLLQRFPGCPAAMGDRCESLVSYVADRPGHDRRYAIDSGKIRGALGFEPVESFKTGIKKTIAWYLENEEWWQKVIDGSYREWVEHHYL